jgi:capsular polysaccharide export protein
VEKYKGEVFFTMRNTFQLINKAELVVTINSSVGVESLMLNKPVVTLGDCFYKSYTSHDLDKVIHHLFIDIDYFSQEELTKGVFEKYIELRGF